ncbi:hypothetical protein NQ314_001577 [Rhamnusium bicolor]|uniref:Uncharacterized protein n=1 Tax=Rhamnusium bicolor TaxID=1586634 RepID=A0AAV8ZV05_9CUCU|nr:hypothetical protein NQ314_001577 [Rhamnusium bicolor]
MACQETPPTACREKSSKCLAVYIASIENGRPRRAEYKCWLKRKNQGVNAVMDHRSKGTTTKKYFSEVHEEIKGYIDSFPREENHYSHNKSAKLFLSPDLNLNRMYRAYIEKCPRSSVTYKFYAEIFHTDFCNLRFGTSNDPEKRNLMNALQLHHRKAEKARVTMNKDMADSLISDTNVISIDFTQVLFLISLTHSAMFYSRQLSCYNLGIDLLDLERAFMCLWDESLTDRGGNEIASGLLKTIR